MADSQGQNYYWQSDNQNTTGENVGSVLDDLCNIVVITEIQDNQNTVTFVPGLNGEKGHFRLGVGSKPINALANELIVGDGNDWAAGNAAKVKILKKTLTDFGSNSAQFETDQVNCFSFQSSMANVEPTTFIIDKGAQILMGKTEVHDYEEGVWAAPTFWNEEIPYPRLLLDGAAQIMMQPKDDMQMPIIQMDGGAIMRFNYNKEHTYYKCFRGNIGSDIRSYEDPFAIQKGGYVSSGIPIFSMHDSPTFQMLDNAVLQVKNGSETVIQGNARVHISGGQWSDSYHARSHINFTAELTRMSSSSNTGTITFDFDDIMITKELYDVHDNYKRNSFDNYKLINSIYEKYNGQPGITITFDNLTEQEFLVPSNFRHVKIKTFYISGTSVEDFDKATEIDIGPNTIIRTSGDTNDPNKGVVISVEPTQIKVGAGNFNDYISQAYFIQPPDYHDAFGNIGDFRSIRNYDFPINKNFLSIDHILTSAFVQDLTDNVSDPYFEITGGSALKIDQNSMVLRCADYGCGLIDDIDITGGSYLANMLCANENSRVEICKNFNGADAVENTHISGKYSKDINLYGNTSIRIGPGSEGQGPQDPQLLGIDLTGVHTDIVGHWKNFQAILSGNDSFINWDGNNHYESWSGTQIFRASNPTRAEIKSKYYPLFTGESGVENSTKTIETQKDLSSYTNQQIADEFGSYFIPAKPENVWNRVYDNPVLDVNGITKTFIGNTYVQSVDLKTSTASSKPYISANVYVYSNTNYTSISAALANATIKEIISEVLNIGGSWDYRSYTRYRHDWDTTVRKYKLQFSMTIDYQAGMKILYHSTASSTPNDFNLPANTKYSQMNAADKAVIDKALEVLDNKVYRNGELVAWCAEGTKIYNKDELITNSPTNYTVTQTGVRYSITATAGIPWHQTAHMGKDWRGPIQTVDRIGQNPAPWEKGPIVQAYGPVNFTMREKWVADTDHTKTFDLTSSATYDVSNQAQAIADFQANTTDYVAFEAYLTQEDYTLWDILSITTVDGGYRITFSICEAGWKPHIDSYPDNPVVEITDGSELRLYGGVKIKGETKYGVTTFTFSGTQSEGEVSFTLDELRSLKALIGSVRTSVVNDASEATEPGIIYFVDEGGNA